MSSDDGQDAFSVPSTSQPVTHLPRKRAVPPMHKDIITEMDKEIAVRATPDPQRVEAANAAAAEALPPHIAKAIAQHPRFGPYIIHFGVWYGGIGALAATYAYGFYGLAKKNQFMWNNSFRQRVLLLGPMLASYCTAHGVVPMPFRSALEAWTGRPAVTLTHLLAADELRKQRELEERLRREDEEAVFQ